METAVGSPELKRCPFCGAAGKVHVNEGERQPEGVRMFWVSVSCAGGEDCGTEGPSTIETSKRKAMRIAVAGWNRRAQLG